MAKKPDQARSRAPNKGSKGARKSDGKSGGRRGDGPARLWLYGRHAVAAALANPARPVRRVLATKNAADWLGEQGDLLAGLDPKQIEDAKPDVIDRLLHPGAVHQGLAAGSDRAAPFAAERNLRAGRSARPGGGARPDH